MGDGTTYRKSLSIPKAALLAVVCFLIGFLTNAKLDYHNGNGDTTATMKTQKDVDAIYDYYESSNYPLVNYASFVGANASNTGFSGELSVQNSSGVNLNKL